MNTMATAVLDMSAARSMATATDAGASVYVSLRPAEPTADTGEDLQLRWRGLAAQLAAQGADGATIAAVWRQLSEQPVSPARYAVFASRGSVRFGQSLPGAVDVDIARYGAPADVVPLLAFLQQHPPYVQVVTDRTGADVTVVRSGAVMGSTTTLVGPDDEIERNAPGGWAQARYQHRAEDSWQHNAGVVAQAVTHALRQVDAGLLLVAGDVRAVQLLRDRLPAAVSRGVVIRQLPGGRHADSSGSLRDAAADAVAQYAAARVNEVMDRLEAERGHGGLAVEGVAATLHALAQGRVQSLLVVDDPHDERMAWFGPDTLCAEMPSQPTTSWEAAGRLIDVAVRAAVLTGAEITVIPPTQDRTLTGRIGAVCRFVQTST